jgi:hypothetical protein
VSERELVLCDAVRKGRKQRQRLALLPTEAWFSWRHPRGTN